MLPMSSSTVMHSTVQQPTECENREIEPHARLLFDWVFSQQISTRKRPCTLEPVCDHFASTF